MKTIILNGSPIFQADSLIIGSPIYLGDITSQVHALIERLHFCALFYDDYSNYFKGKVNVGIILTMNVPKAYFEQGYQGKAVPSRFGGSISFGREAPHCSLAFLVYSSNLLEYATALNVKQDIKKYMEVMI